MLRLRTMAEAIFGFILLIASFLTSAFLPLFGHIYFSKEDRKKIKRNLELCNKREFEREEQFQSLEKRFPLNEKRKKIVNMAEEKLIDSLQNRKLSAKEVVEAFIAKAVVSTRKFNSVTQFITESLVWAAELDKLEQVKGPLHGVPVSLKEHILVVGYDSTIGFAQFLDKPAEKDGLIVDALKALGAVPFCKTNIPQSLFTFGCGNAIYGEALNPLNPKLSPGGSSGGCASLVSSGGSILSLGTDIGGSVRIPAHFCGVVSLRPTSSRMTVYGARTTGLVAPTVRGTYGFITKNTKMLTYAYKSLFESGIQHSLDPNAVPIPWNEQMISSKRKLKIGYYTSNEYFPIIGDTEEVVLNSVAKLKAEGHEVVPFEMPDLAKVMELFFGGTHADLGKVFSNIWKGESVSDAALTTYWIARLPLRLRQLLAYLVEFQFGPLQLPIFHSPLFAKLLRAGETSWISADLCQKLSERAVMLNSLTSQWKSKNIDVLVCPTFPFPAIPYNGPGKVMQAAGTTAVWNFFDFPAGVVPFGKESGKKISSYDNRGDFILRLGQKYAKQSVGMPIAVQIVGLPYQEELVLQVMSLVESLRQNG